METRKGKGGWLEGRELGLEAGNESANTSILPTDLSFFVSSLFSLCGRKLFASAIWGGGGGAGHKTKDR